MVINRKLGKSFKKVGNIYHIGRKEYPNKLIQDIIKISSIKKDGSILDVGCGTGKSKIPFAKRGYKTTGIDISEKMLSVAKKLSSKYKNVEYIRTSFEDARLKPNSFDLILFGTSVHWLDQKMVYEKSHDLLKKNGYIAIFWDPFQYLDEKVRQLKIRDIFLKHCPNYPRNPRVTSVISEKTRKILQYNLFHDPIIKRYPAVKKYSRNEFFALIKSCSWFISINKKKKDIIIRELNKILDKEKEPIRVRTNLCLMIAKRRE